MCSARPVAGLVCDHRPLDGQIEAVSLPGAQGFLLGLQWHPEWRWAEDEISRAIFAAFGRAMRPACAKPELRFGEGREAAN